MQLEEPLPKSGVKCGFQVRLRGGLVVKFPLPVCLLTLTAGGSIDRLVEKICIFGKNKAMGAIIIKADKKSNKILADLAKKLGGNVLNLADDQYEDFALGSLMDSVKTGETVSSESIMAKLKGK